MTAKKILTVERLKELLHYDPVTGVFTWRLGRGGKAASGTIAGTLTESGYRAITVDRVKYMAQQLAWLYVYGEFPGCILDHENTKKDENRIENLRPATKSNNAANAEAHRDNTSGHKGVSWSKVAKKWRASIGVNGKQIHLGYFVDKEDAARAYTSAAQKHFKEFAR